MATPIPQNSAEFSAAELRQATGAIERLAAGVRGVVTDSRRVQSRCLFVALRGANQDGHAFIDAACQSGAAAVLVDHEVSVPAGVGVYESQDTLRSLGGLGAFHRRRFELPLVAVTGSIGKTSTKDLIAAGLAGSGRNVLATTGNLNNRIGVPMTLLGLEPGHGAAVIEIGMNMPGEIAELTEQAQPTVGVVTAVTEAHLERVGGIEGVAREKGALLAGLPSEGVAVWCSDYPLLRAHAEASPARRKLSYGSDEQANVRLLSWSMDPTPATQCVFRLEKQVEIDLRLRQLGKGAALNVAGAIATLLALDLEPDERAWAALAQAPATPGRMVPVTLANDVLAIDDSYNSSPRAVLSALETAAALAKSRGGRLIAVLGDMLELGASATALHEEIGRETIRAGATVFVACGALMAQGARAALSAAMDQPRASRARVVIVKDTTAATECAREAMQARDVVLVKGSRGMRMERVIESLLSEEA